MWYGCSLTRSHSSADSGPGLFQTRAATATRPRSWTSAARRIAPRSEPRAAPLGRRLGQIGDARRVADEGWRDEIGERAHRRQRTIDRLALQRQRRVWLGGERLLPRRSLAIARQDLGRVVGEAGGDPRVERPSCALADDGGRALHPSQEMLDGGVSATLAILMANGISSRLARRSAPLPSQRSVSVTKRPCTEVGRPSRWASISPTSQSATMCGLLLLAALGSRRATWIARTGAALSGSGSARTTPASISRCEPNRTGPKVASDHRRISRRRPPHPRCSRNRRAGRRSRSPTPSPDRSPAARPAAPRSALRADRARTGSPWRRPLPGTTPPPPQPCARAPGR